VFTARYGLGLKIKRPALRLLKVKGHCIDGLCSVIDYRKLKHVVNRVLISA
jgi:hypothetical protein